MALYSKHGGSPQKLPFQDAEEDGTIWTDLANNPEGRTRCGWAPSTTPERVSKMQMRLALSRAGLLHAVENYIDASDNDELRIYYDDALEFWRIHPMTLLVQQVLSKTDEEVDNLFTVAKAIF